MNSIMIISISAMLKYLQAHKQLIIIMSTVTSTMFSFLNFVLLFAQTSVIHSRIAIIGITPQNAAMIPSKAAAYIIQQNSIKSPAIDISLNLNVVVGAFRFLGMFSLLLNLVLYTNCGFPQECKEFAKNLLIYFIIHVNSRV